MPLCGDLHGRRRACGGTTHDIPMCRRVLNALAIHLDDRSIRFMIDNTPSMGFNHGAYGGTKSSSTPIECAKARTQWER